ncbi:MAG: PEP-utilizing enzyme [Patescibacteria group bacterium]
MANINWRVYVRDHIYPQSISAYLDLMQKQDVSRYPYLARFYEVMSFVGSHFWWARDLDQLEKRFRHWMRQWTGRPLVLRSYLRSFRRSVRQVRHDIPHLKHQLTSPRLLTNQQLLDIFQQARLLFWGNILYSEYGVDLFDDFFDRILIEQFGPELCQRIVPHDWIALMRPAYTSVVTQYKTAVLTLSFKKRVPDGDINRVASRFYWIMMSWDGSHKLTAAQVQHDIRVIRRKSLSARKSELKNLAGHASKVLHERKRLFSRYTLPKKKLWPYFQLLDIFTALHDDRKECQMRNSQVIFSVLKETARRFRVPYNDVVYYFNDEIERLCAVGRLVPHHVIAARKKGVTMVIKNNETKVLIGQPAHRAVKRLVLDAIRHDHAAEIKGISAQPGRVRSRALVTESAKVANRTIKKGDILIAPMTTVDYVPAMHKAAAIVTDDGGLACHAAIVARELGLPCVVGTKVATQMLKTGDQVEVDAVKGIVKKV